MKLVYMGAEIPSNRTLLTGMGVTSLGVGFKALRERVKGDRLTLLRSFPEDVDIHLYPGLGTAELDIDDLRELEAHYHEFIEANVDRLSSWTEFDALGPDDVRSNRDGFYAQYDPYCFRPVWRAEHGTPLLEALAEQYPHVMIPQSTLREQPGIFGVVRTLHSRYETMFHVLSATAADQQYVSPAFGDLHTLMWVAPMKNGETVVWHGGSLHRYQKSQKDVRKDLVGVIEQAGLNITDILDDKPKELARLAIWSLQQWESKAGLAPILSLVVDNNDQEESGPDADQVPGVPDTRGGNPAAMDLTLPTARQPHERGVLPSMGVEFIQSIQTNSDGSTTIADLPVVTSKGGTVRNCDSCFVAHSCPARKPGHECAFHLPVEVKTRDQLIALMQAMIEMQASRVAFARFSEELAGGYPDVSVSKEMDRLFKLVHTLKKTQEDHSFVKMTVEGKAGAGILSSIFGERAQQAITPTDS